MTWKIIADSGCDYRQLEIPAIDTTFVSVPLTIQVADQVFVDDVSLDIDQMMVTMYATKKKKLQNQLVQAQMIICEHSKVPNIFLSLR